jgi:hypothetical protein
VYAQHLNALGNARFPGDGLPLSAFRAAFESPAIACVTGGFGAIVVWRDFRADTAGNLYAQRLSPAGEALWGTNGVTVNAGPLHEVQPVAVSDGAGGVIVAWRDDRDGSAYQVRAQRLSAFGTSAWDPDGVLVGPNPSLQDGPRIVTDATPGASGACGAVIAWTDWRGLATNAYAQRLSADGLPQWASSGEPLSSTTQGASLRALAPDDRGGAYAALIDYRHSGNSWQHAFAQHVDRTGAIVWAGDGVPLSSDAWPVYDVQSCRDEAGGAFFGWRDYENGGNNHVFAARRDSAGGALGSGEVGFGFEGNGFFGFSMAADGCGGALFAWNGLDGGTYSVFTQRVDAAAFPLWAANGVTAARSSGVNAWPRVVTDGRGGGIVGWLDYTPAWVSDLYAARVDRDGQPGTAGVPAPEPPATLALSAGPSPVRAGGSVTLRLALPVAGWPRVTVLDVAGRRVAVLSPGASGAGLVTLRWDGRDAGGRRVAPGLYLARVEAGGLTATTRIVVTD